MAKGIWNLANALVNLLLFLFLGTAGLYAGFALWDNNRIYTAAMDVQADMIRCKPTPEGSGGASFQELLEINPDICGWVTLEGTKIDYPVLQGSSNLTYINQDVYGNFALAGSIFLDTRNGRDFSDVYSLLYGHHMENSGMFGDLDKYKTDQFFEAHSTGTLLLPEGSYELEIFACLLTDAGEENIFDPERWQADIEAPLSFVESRAMHLRKETLDSLRQLERPKILALSTCASEFTDARTVVLAVMVGE